MKPTGLTAMHSQHLELGATMVEREGWQRPTHYTDVEDELDRVRRAVGLCDISPVGKLILQGDGIEALLNGLMPDLEPPVVGAVAHGSVVLDSTPQPVSLARLARDEAMVLTGPGETPRVATALERAARGCAHVLDATSGFAGVSVAGPLGRSLLEGVTELNVSPDGFPDMSCAQGGFAGVYGLLIRRDLGPVLHYELYFGREFGAYLWEALIEAGQDYSVVPFGTEALARLKTPK